MNIAVSHRMRLAVRSPGPVSPETGESRRVRGHRRRQVNKMKNGQVPIMASTLMLFGRNIGRAVHFTAS